MYGRQEICFFVLGVIGLIIHIMALIQMYEIMGDKGYSNTHTRAVGMVLCTLLGPVGWLYVAALPDVNLQEQTTKLLELLEEERQ